MAQIDERLVKMATVLVRRVGEFLDNEKLASLLGELVSPLFAQTNFLPIVEEARAQLSAPTSEVTKEKVVAEPETEVAGSPVPVVEPPAKAKKAKAQASDFIEVGDVRLKRRVILEMARTGQSQDCPVVGCGDLDKPEKSWVGPNCFCSGRGGELIHAVKKAVQEAGGKGIILPPPLQENNVVSSQKGATPEEETKKAERLEGAKDVVRKHLRLGGEAHLRPGTFANLVLRGPAKAECTHGLLTVACARILDGDAALREKIEKGATPPPASQDEENLLVADNKLQRRTSGDRRPPVQGIGNNAHTGKTEKERAKKEREATFAAQRRAADKARSDAQKTVGTRSNDSQRGFNRGKKNEKGGRRKAA